MTVHFYSKVKGYTNGEASYSPASTITSTLRELLDELILHYGKSFETFINGTETCLFLVNSKGIKLSGGLDTPIKPGDKIEILPFVEAG